MDSESFSDSSFESKSILDLDDLCDYFSNEFARIEYLIGIKAFLCERR